MTRYTELAEQLNKILEDQELSRIGEGDPDTFSPLPYEHP